MKTIGHSGGVAILGFLFEELFKTLRRISSAKHRHTTRQSSATISQLPDNNLEKQTQENLERLQQVADSHKDYSAEVIPYYIKGKNRVKTFRLLNPGNEVELRLHDDDIKILAFGEYITDLLILKESHLQEVMKHGLPFHAYLGGRDPEYRYNDDFDLGNVIVFYKIEGLPPTQVTIQIN